MASVGEILGWKFDHVEGITTSGAEIVEWPASLGPEPDAAQIAAWESEYDAAHLANVKRAELMRSRNPADNILLEIELQTAMDSDEPMSLVEIQRYLKLKGV